MRRRAFTLIEILVVVSIIALLIGILVPVLSKAKNQARRVTCATQLHHVGVAMVAYMQDSRDRMPEVSFMPSLGPAPLTTDKPIYFADVLARHLKGQKDVLHCPNDQPSLTDRPAPNTGLSFFQSERSSYEYRISLAGLTPMQFSKRPHGPPGLQHQHTDDKTSPNTIWFSRDYENFHGPAGQIGARRYIYIDGHVSDYEN
jgi:prepilin-type N-terminal cleavage/methylation domain-containing protein